jgi:predicted nucleic acid-binding protein
VDAFDSDVLIYAAARGHPLGERVAALFPAHSPGSGGPKAGVGSVLLLPEVLSKPLRDGDAEAVRSLSELLAMLDLRPVDQLTAVQAAVLGARYKLRLADAMHLATAISVGAQRFITNNSKDFGPFIKEIDVTFPADLPGPPATPG